MAEEFYALGGLIIGFIGALVGNFLRMRFGLSKDRKDNFQFLFDKAGGIIEDLRKENKELKNAFRQLQNEYIECLIGRGEPPQEPPHSHRGG